VKGKVYAFDSTTIDLCLSVFWWAKFRKAKGGIKIHTLYDITTYCLVAIIGHDLKLERSTYEILTVLGISLLDKTPVKELFSKIDNDDVKDLNYNQLSLSLF